MAIAPPESLTTIWRGFGGSAWPKAGPAATPATTPHRRNDFAASRRRKFRIFILSPSAHAPNKPRATPRGGNRHTEGKERSGGHQTAGPLLFVSCLPTASGVRRDAAAVDADAIAAAVVAEAVLSLKLLLRAAATFRRHGLRRGGPVHVVRWSGPVAIVTDGRPHRPGMGKSGNAQRLPRGARCADRQKDRPARRLFRHKPHIDCGLRRLAPGGLAEIDLTGCGEGTALAPTAPPSRAPISGEPASRPPTKPTPAPMPPPLNARSAMAQPQALMPEATGSLSLSQNVS